MALTSKQEKFCQEILKGKTQTEAYNIAFPSSLNWKRNSTDCEASKLMSDTKIIQRIAELKKPIEQKIIKEFAKTKIDLLNELEMIKQMSFDKDDLREVRESIKEQGKMLGFYEENLKVKGELDLHNSLAVFKKRLEEKEKEE
jgi:phage terminase small subunit